VSGNPAWFAGQAATVLVSPDKKIMMVLTSGYNRYFNTTTGVMDCQTRPNISSSTTFDGRSGKDAGVEDLECVPWDCL